MSGTPRWEKERSLLTFNLRVENFYKHKIDLEPTKNKYDITIKNATWGDINATYTCHVGYDCKQISPVEFYTGTFYCTFQNLLNINLMKTTHAFWYQIIIIFDLFFYRFFL